MNLSDSRRSPRSHTDAWVTAAFLLVGAVLLGFTAYQYFVASQLERTGSVADGEVIRLAFSNGAQLPTFRFKDSSGLQLDVQSRVSTDGLAPGARVQVLYDPTDVTSARIRDATLLYAPTVQLGAMALGFLTAGFLLMWFARRRRSQQEHAGLGRHVAHREFGGPFGALIFGIGATSIGLSLMAGGLYTRHSTRAFLAHALRTEAIVVSRADGRSGSFPTFQFTDGMGKIHVVQSGQSDLSIHRGDIVQVAYDPDDPDSALLLSSELYQFAPWALIGIGTPFLAIGTLLIVFHKRANNGRIDLRRRSVPG